MENLASVSTTMVTTRESSPLSQLSEDYTRFLTLLTAQIAHQDPLEPMDSSQFVTQLAQLSQVEQSVKVNSNLESIQDKLASFSTIVGANMLGRNVTFTSEIAELTNGVSNTSYRLAGPASTVTAEIRDDDGTLIRTIRELSGQSENVTQLDWDGLDDAGLPVADGAYTVTVNALTEDGSEVSAAVFQDATVEEFILDFGAQYLALSNGEQLALENVLAVK